MIRLLVHLAVLPFCLTGNITLTLIGEYTEYCLNVYKFIIFSVAELSKNSVRQTPTALIKHPGEQVLLNCSHSNTNFNMILWYKQSAGKNDMVLLGYVRYSSPTVEAQFKDKYNVSGNGGSLASLHVPKLSGSEDSAAYFCAASSAQCCTKPVSLTKTLSDAAEYTKTQVTT